jgi:hypothetical protein
MIEIYAPLNGLVAIVAADDIKAITVALGASAYRGVASFVRLGDGSTIESSQSADTLRKLIEAETCKRSADMTVIIEHLAGIRESVGESVLFNIESGITELEKAMDRIGRNI